MPIPEDFNKWKTTYTCDCEEQPGYNVRDLHAAFEAGKQQMLGAVLEWKIAWQYWHDTHPNAAKGFEDTRACYDLAAILKESV